jgi:hypothetical protein
MVFPVQLPNAPGFQNPIVLRALAALPAAGAFDAAPLEVPMPGIEAVLLYIQYTRAAAAGAINFQLQFSPFSIDQLVYENWYTMSMYSAGMLAAGADVVSEIQRESVTYVATGAAVETYVYGPVRIAGIAQRIRVRAREIGNLANPGTGSILGVAFLA